MALAAVGRVSGTFWPNLSLQSLPILSLRMVPHATLALPGQSQKLLISSSPSLVSAGRMQSPCGQGPTSCIQPVPTQRSTSGNPGGTQAKPCLFIFPKVGCHSPMLRTSQLGWEDEQQSSWGLMDPRTNQSPMDGEEQPH